MENELELLDTEMINLGAFITNELRTACPYRTGNMQRSIALTAINGNSLEIIIAVDYASYVNTSGIHKGWIDKVLDLTSRCYAQNNVDDESLSTGFSYKVLYGEKG